MADALSFYVASKIAQPVVLMNIYIMENSLAVSFH